MLTCGCAMAALSISAKQEQNAQVPSLHAVCGPDLGHSNFAIWEGLFTHLQELVTHNQIFLEQ